MTEGKPRNTEELIESGRPLEPVLVEAVSGPAAGVRVPMATGLFSIGSEEGCDVRLTGDPSVSRRHLSVELLPGALNLRDLGSRNGTYYLGARIHLARVPLGSSIRIGRTIVRFTPISPQAPVSHREELFGLVGPSLAMRRAFAVLEKLGPSDSTVLLRGESGTGKEEAARALHRLSPRATRPFMVFECGSVKGELAHSELFGHLRGAFTGAHRGRAGAVEAAAGGTLLLDEVGELALEMQPLLLRLIETREFRRLGETAYRKADFRLLATTQRDLEAEVAAGRFRSDLFHRLSVMVVELPPLRARPEDLPALVAHFARELTGEEVPFSPATLAALQCSPWPGNVRQLRNAVERALSLGAFSAEKPEEPRTPPTYRELIRRVERDYLATLLEQHRGNVSAVARISKIARSQLYRLLERHRLAGRVSSES